jgi:hypothetical protein
VGIQASQEANLPTAYELKDIISNLLNIQFDYWHKQEKGDLLIASALQTYLIENKINNNITPYLQDVWHIRDALPLAQSIDTFIHAQRDNVIIITCGKLAIVRAILEAEKASRLYFTRDRIDSTVAFTSLESTWYTPFFRLLVGDCTKNDLKTRFASVTLLIFNYDRCVEHFLLSALQNYFKISESDAAKFISYLNIYHPYGSVGSLPWCNNDDSVDFGADPTLEQLLKLAKKIKTFTEGADPYSSEILQIRRKMAKADMLIFLGFAFHKLNMELIVPDHDFTIQNPKCYATAHGISSYDQPVIRTQIDGLYNSTINSTIVNSTCSAFFAECWRSLAF